MVLCVQRDVELMATRDNALAVERFDDVRQIPRRRHPLRRLVLIVPPVCVLELDSLLSCIRERGRLLLRRIVSQVLLQIGGDLKLGHVDTRNAIHEEQQHRPPVDLLLRRLLMPLLLLELLVPRINRHEWQELPELRVRY